MFLVVFFMCCTVAVWWIKNESSIEPSLTGSTTQVPHRVLTAPSDGTPDRGDYTHVLGILLVALMMFVATGARAL